MRDQMYTLQRDKCFPANAHNDIATPNNETGLSRFPLSTSKEYPIGAPLLCSGPTYVTSMREVRSFATQGSR